jgi:hypothetical protein
MRNIKRVILWGVPPSFCALVQRAGRAARDFRTLGEAILIVPPSIMKKGLTEVEVALALEDAAKEDEPENRSDETVVALVDQGIEVAGGNEEILVDEGGVRASHGSDDEEDGASKTRTQRRKKTSKDCNSREARYLTLFMCAERCRHGVWDEFFVNNKKRVYISSYIFCVTHLWDRFTKTG